MINAQLDFYDDPTGSVLKQRVSSFNDVPDFIKTAERLTPGELDKLPDDVFALVALDGGRKMRKFACVDKGNTALSVLYFLENKDRLPIEAQKTAAANLITACGWYGLDVPGVLEKVALLGAAMGALTMGSGLAQGHKDFKKRQAAMDAGMPAGEAFKLKAGELSGSSPMPYGVEIPEKQAAAMGKGTNSKLVKKIVQEAGEVASRVAMSSKEKKASLQPYVDVTGKQPPAPVVRETGRFYALIKEGGARYPIDTAAQVQQAFLYFEKYASRFTPHERHRYCANVCRRADELGLNVPETIAKYGSVTMAKDAGVQIYRRQRLFHEGTTEHGLLQEMREKCAAVRPEVLAVALENFDREHGLDRMWGNGLDDPYFSIFGVEKTAEWSFVDGNDYINETRLKRLASDMGMKEAIEERFGDEMAEEFAKNPKQIFDSLPLDSKRIIMRLSQQVEE